MYYQQRSENPGHLSPKANDLSFSPAKPREHITMNSDSTPLAPSYYSVQGKFKLSKRRFSFIIISTTKLEIITTHFVFFCNTYCNFYLTLDMGKMESAPSQYMYEVPGMTQYKCQNMPPMPNPFQGKAILSRNLKQLCLH